MAAMLLRIVFVVNLFKHFASFRTLHGYRKLKENKMHTNFLLHLRHGLLKSPFYTFTCLFVTLVITYACLLQIFEQPYYYSAYLVYEPYPHVEKDPFYNIWDAVWLTVITMTGVGYGDIFAVTLFGRITTLAIALSGSILVAVLVSTMARHLVLKPSETKVLYEIEEEQIAAIAI